MAYKDPTKESSQDQRRQMYVKALVLKDTADVEKIKSEVFEGNIVIVKITELARRDMEKVRAALSALYEHTRLNGGDIARLGDERIVLTPPSVKIWRKNGTAPMANVAGNLMDSE